MLKDQATNVFLLTTDKGIWVYIPLETPGVLGMGSTLHKWA